MPWAPQSSDAGGTSGRASEGDGWAVEPKLAGWRAIITVTAGAVDASARRGRNVSDRLLELADLATAVPVDTVLDGACGATGPSRRLLRGGGTHGCIEPRRGLLTFVAFDVLELDDTCVIGLRYRERRGLLDLLVFEGPA